MVTGSITRPLGQDELYQDASRQFGDALARLVRGYEVNEDRRGDLLQEIHLALWQSFAHFDGRCSLRTWVYRVAHNVATSHVIRDRRFNSRVLVGLEGVVVTDLKQDNERSLDHRLAVEKLVDLIQKLRPVDRQVILSYLEGLDAAATAEITGLSPGNIATRIHRIKHILARQFHEEGGSHVESDPQ